MKKYNFHGFPVVQEAELVGYITRDRLAIAIDCIFSQEPAPSPTRRCTFLSRRATTEYDLEDLSDVVEEAVLQLRKEQPQELVVDMFQKLVSVTTYFLETELRRSSHRICDRFYSRTKES